MDEAAEALVNLLKEAAKEIRSKGGKPRLHIDGEEVGEVWDTSFEAKGPIVKIATESGDLFLASPRNVFKLRGGTRGGMKFT